jgi:hypothetical protein
LEDLVKEKEFNQQLKELVENSGRAWGPTQTLPKGGLLNRARQLK